MKEKEYYEKIKKWNFDKFQIETERLTKWDLYETLNKITNKESKILDLGTGGGEKLLKYFPNCKEILGTDYSKEMIKTAEKNLIKTKKKKISFKEMDNLNMTVPDEYFDVVVARNTITDPKQIYKCLKPGGYLLIQGVDKLDCWNLKRMFKKGQGYNDIKSLSQIDYEKILDANFKDVELIPIHEREYFNNKNSFKEFIKTVPIIYEYNDDSFNKELDNNKLEQYIKENTYNRKIKLIRRYYGIIAKKGFN